MSKVAAYLRGHIEGEVVTREDVREALSTDGGVLKIIPEMVIYPRSTNDIRKAARFSWQLAEKGHKLPITVRGAGLDATGAAIGKGISLVMPAHMNQIYEFDAKQKLVRLQPGVTIGALSQGLALQGAAVMSLVGEDERGTIGGAVGSAVAGRLAGKYQTISTAIDQIEVVLANGDVLQTKRVGKRELDRLKGKQGFVGDIYRGVDRILEDYADVISEISPDDMAGYNAIANVRNKDGSFDLAPLFVGSQGTLGVIAELIVKVEFRSLQNAVAGLVFSDGNAARDAVDVLCKMNPAFVEYFDASFFEAAAKEGREHAFYVKASQDLKAKPAAVLLAGFDEFSERSRAKALKKIEKIYGKQEGVAVTVADGEKAEPLLAALDITKYTKLPSSVAAAAPGLYSGFHIPTERLEDFVKSITALAEKERLELPLAGHAQTNTYTVFPSFSLSKVADKQKIFKLLDEITKLVYAHGGTMISEGGEGRLKAKFVYKQIDEKLVKMYDEIRTLFDPHETLNTGVKQIGEVRAMAELLRDHHLAGQNARYGL